MRLINGEKDWKRVSMQKVVTLNTCGDVACLTFAVHAIRHNRLFSQPPTIIGKQCTFSQINKFYISQGNAVTSSDVVGKFTVMVTVCFILRKRK